MIRPSKHTSCVVSPLSRDAGINPLVVNGFNKFDRILIAHSQHAIELDFIGGALQQSGVFEKCERRRKYQ